MLRRIICKILQCHGGNDEGGENCRHPLDGCDPDKLYEIMMDERRELIRASRDSQDNLVKTVVTTSAALVALMVGFISQASTLISKQLTPLLGWSVSLLIFSMVLALIEHLFSARANDRQRRNVEEFYSKKIDKCEDPWENKVVQTCQWTSLLFFVFALGMMGRFAFLQSEDRSHEQSQRPAASAASAAAAASAASAASAQAD